MSGKWDGNGLRGETTIELGRSAHAEWVKMMIALQPVHRLSLDSNLSFSPRSLSPLSAQELFIGATQQEWELALRHAASVAYQVEWVAKVSIQPTIICCLLPS